MESWSEPSPAHRAHPARVAVAEVSDDVSALAAANLSSLSDAEVLDLRLAMEREQARFHSQVLRVTQELDARGLAGAAGATSTQAWLRGRAGLHPGAAKAEVRLAGELDGSLPATAVALAAGEISLAGAHAVADAIRRLPGAVDADTRARGEAYLVEQAKNFDPQVVARLGRHLLHVLDPDGCELEREEARQEWAEAFTVVHGHDGSRRLTGRLTPEHGALLDAALDVLAAPRPAADGTRDPRGPEKRRADALVDLVRMGARSDDMPWCGGEPVTMTVTTTAEHLAATSDADSVTGGIIGTAGTPVAAVLEDGTPVSPEATRRLACDAWLVAAIIDSAEALLDIGRRSRIVPAAMRRALIVRDRGCAFPGCGRPARWCQAHHVVHWALGGDTKLDNLVLLCPHHHRVVHHDGWQIGWDEHRLPYFVPPPWIDPDQIPRPPWRPPDHLRI